MNLVLELLSALFDLVIIVVALPPILWLLTKATLLELQQNYDIVRTQVINPLINELFWRTQIHF